VFGRHKLACNLDVSQPGKPQASFFLWKGLEICKMYFLFHENEKTMIASQLETKPCRANTKALFQQAY